MADEYLQRFGPRVNWSKMNTVSDNRMAEFFFACRNFMANWSSQFRTTVRLTFMPEAYPGMMLCLPMFGMQGYIREVAHSWDLGGGGFTTDVQAAPWSSMGPREVGVSRFFPKGAPL